MGCVPESALSRQIYRAAPSAGILRHLNNHGGPDVTDDGTTEGGDSYYENGLWWYWDDDYDAYYSILE